jgi:predicted transposase YbfD/YdcC
MPHTPPTAQPLEIAKHFSSLEDPRVVGRSAHPLLNVIVMALVGVICGANGWDDIREIAVDRADWFGRWLVMANGVPSADTFRRVLGALQPEAFSACVASWVNSLVEPLDGQVIAFDGKTIRGALKRTPLGSTLHQVHVWCNKQKLLLAHVGVAGAPEEIDAARKLLATIDLRGAIVTGDAAHACAETAQKIIEGGADYVLQVKANRAALYSAVDRFFEMAKAEDDAGVPQRHARTAEVAHGRSEVREAWSVAAARVPLPGTAWTHLRSITMIERTRETAERRSTERHYYLSSLPPSVRKLMSAVREHWNVENGLHWRLDVQMEEDACTIHDESAAQNFATLRRIALMLLQREPSLKRGISARREKAARNTSYLESVLTRGIP